MSSIRSCNTDIPPENWNRIFGKEEKVGKKDLSEQVVEKFEEMLDEMGEFIYDEERKLLVEFHRWLGEMGDLWQGGEGD